MRNNRKSVALFAAWNTAINMYFSFIAKNPLLVENYPCGINQQTSSSFYYCGEIIYASMHVGVDCTEIGLPVNLPRKFPCLYAFNQG